MHIENSATTTHKRNTAPQAGGKACRVCGRQYRPNSNNQGICGLDCWRSWKREQRRESRSRYSASVLVQPLTRLCVICGVKYVTCRTHQVTCGAEACQKALIIERRKTEWRRHKDANPEAMARCVVCGSQFDQKHPAIVACSEDCRKVRRAEATLRHKRAMADRETLRETVRQCLKCDTSFPSRNGARLCDRCRQENAQVLEWGMGAGL